MRNNHLDSENFEQVNTSYQTGGFNHKPAGKSSGLIAFLLVLVIFLGGLASGLGLLNIRLLHKLMDQPEPTVHVGLSVPESNALSTTPIASADDPVPQVPQQSNTRLQLKSAAHGSDHQVTYDLQSIQEAAAVSQVTVQAFSHTTSVEGLGLVISEDGYILTNNHLLDSASHIYVVLADGQQLRACLVGSDILTDIAVLYVQTQGLTPASFGSGHQLQEGDLIASVPFYGQQGLTEGSVSVQSRTVSLGMSSLRLLQTTVGSNCGPVYDRYGHVVAMNSSQVADYFDLCIQTDVGFAVPSDTIESVVNQILEQGYVTGRPTLGIQTEVISKMYQKYWNLPGGLRLTEVSEAAQAQGLKEGDILLAFNGVRLQSQADLAQVLLSNATGYPMTAVIFRDGSSLTLSLTILEDGQ